MEPPHLALRTQRVAQALSEPRLEPYLRATQNNLTDAITLYQWNIQFSGAVYQALHIFEVILRNSLDRELATWNCRQVNRITGDFHSQDWLLDPAPLIVRLAGADIARARNRMKHSPHQKSGQEPKHSDVLAQLSLGTWRFLLPDRDPGRRYLWEHALKQAFPLLTFGSESLVDRVDRIYRLRNRVAHLEPLLRSSKVRENFNNIRIVLKTIDPIIEEWFLSQQNVTRILRHRPKQ